MLEAAGEMARLVLEIHIDAWIARHLQRNQVRVSRTIEIRLDGAHRCNHPVALRLATAGHIEQAIIESAVVIHRGERMRACYSNHRETRVRKAEVVRSRAATWLR